MLFRSLESVIEGHQTGIASGIAAISDRQPAPRPTPTELGQRTAERLIAARREALARLLDGWEPEQHADVASLLSRLAEELHVGRPGLVEAQ